MFGSLFPALAARIRVKLQYFVKYPKELEKELLIWNIIFNYCKWIIFFILLIEYLLVCMVFDPIIESQVYNYISNIFIQDYLASTVLSIWYRRLSMNEHSAKIGISETNHLNVERSGRDSIICTYS